MILSTKIACADYYHVVFSVQVTVMQRTVRMTLTCFIIQVYSCSGSYDKGVLSLEKRNAETDASYHKDSNANINSKGEVLARFAGQVKRAL